MARDSRPHPRLAGWVLRRVLRDSGTPLKSVTADRAFAAWTDFARKPFRVPDEPDSDMLLYEVGVFDWGKGSHFELSLVRQFIRNGGDSYLQARCELLFPATAELRAVGDAKQWWHPGDERSLTEWTSALTLRPEWPYMRAVAPVRVKIGVERV